MPPENDRAGLGWRRCRHTLGLAGVAQGIFFTLCRAPCPLLRTSRSSSLAETVSVESAACRWNALLGSACKRSRAPSVCPVLISTIWSSFRRETPRSPGVPSRHLPFGQLCSSGADPDVATSAKAFWSSRRLLVSPKPRAPRMHPRVQPEHARERRRARLLILNMWNGLQRKSDVDTRGAPSDGTVPLPSMRAANTAIGLVGRRRPRASMAWRSIWPFSRTSVTPRPNTTACSHKGWIVMRHATGLLVSRISRSGAGKGERRTIFSCRYGRVRDVASICLACRDRHARKVWISTITAASCAFPAAATSDPPATIRSVASR